MERALLDAGLLPVERMAEAGGRGSVRKVYVREYCWALSLGRLVRADFAFPVPRVLLEVSGIAHAIDHGKHEADVERAGMARELGWRLMEVSPKRVSDPQVIRDLLRLLDLEETT